MGTKMKHLIRLIQQYDSDSNELDVFLARPWSVGDGVMCVHSGGGGNGCGYGYLGGGGYGHSIDHKGYDGNGYGDGVDDYENDGNGGGNGWLNALADSKGFRLNLRWSSGQ